MTGKKILVTGRNIDTKYNRNLVIINGLRNAGYIVDEYNFSKFNKKSGRKIRELSQQSYFTYIPSFGHKSVSFVKKYSVCDVVFDPLISKYMTNVNDYSLYGRYSYEALRSWFRDKSSTRVADFVIFDTFAQREYFLKNYKIPENKTGVVYVGANNKDFDRTRTPKYPTNITFKVGFVGHFIPLQGVLTILEAAKINRDDDETEFIFIGEGFQYEKALTYATEHNLSNVKFEGKVEYSELDSFINSFDLCLGIFGNTLKSTVVIPNKIFNYASCGKPVLTMESKAVKEIFSHGDNIYFCKPEATEICTAIKMLKKDPGLRRKMGDNILKLVSEKFDEEQTAVSLVSQYQKFKEA